MFTFYCAELLILIFGILFTSIFVFLHFFTFLLNVNVAQVVYIYADFYIILIFIFFTFLHSLYISRLI